MQKNGHRAGTGTTDPVAVRATTDAVAVDPVAVSQREMWDRAHQRYLESGVWKCSLSPTGAHHWIGDEVSLTCKYCKKVTEAPVGLPSWVLQTIYHKQRTAVMKRLLVEQFI